MRRGGNMKKKMFYFAIIVIALACLLAGCSKDIKVSKKGHELILDAGESTYIAVEDGKSYIYSLKNSKKLTKEGFDRLGYLRISPEMPSENFLLAYNVGDIGYSVANSKGERIIVSTNEMKIDDARLYCNFTKDGDTISHQEKLLIIDFLNAENEEHTAAFKADGTVLFYDKNGNVQLSYLYNEDDSSYIDYVIAETYGTIDDIDNKLIRYEVFDSNLTSIYSQSFNKDIVYMSSDVKEIGSELGYINYRKKEGAIITNYSDIFADGKAYPGFNVVNDRLLDDNGDLTAYLLAKNNPETGVSEYTLLNKTGVVKTFNESYSVFNNNIHFEVNGNLNVMNYEGTTILTGVNIYGMNMYSQITGDTRTIFNMEGQRLFDTAATVSIDGNELRQNGKVMQFFVLTNIENAKTYKFFVDGLLVKEYGDSYTFDSFNGESMVFTTSNEGVIDYVYNYNILANIETTVAANAEGEMDVEINREIIISGGRSADYFVQKESKEIVFYNGIVSTITPYVGDKIPSYSVDTGDYTIQVKTIWHRDNSHSYIVITYEALTKTQVPGSVPITYSYESTGETLYAYYLLKGKDLGNGLIELYSGYNKVDVFTLNEGELIVVSTVDMFANEMNEGRYSNLDLLKDKTTIYKVTYDTDKKLYNDLTLYSVFNESNATGSNSDYLICDDYTYPGLTNLKQSIYKLDGTKVLDAKYRVENIVGDIAILAIGDSEGVYDLKKGKFLEDIKYSDADAINEKCYAFLTISENGRETTIKTNTGKKVLENCKDITLLRRIYNESTQMYTDHFVIYNGKNEQKLLSITYERGRRILS